MSRLKCKCLMLFSAPRAYPTHVRVYPRTEHSVRVTWRGISTTVDEEALEGYIVSFIIPMIIGPRREKTCLRDSRQNEFQTGFLSY